MTDRKFETARIADPCQMMLLVVLITSNAFAQDAEGFTEPVREIQVAAAESGIVSGIHVRDGQQVTKGEVLATLDCEVLNATLRYALAKASANGAIDQARVEWELRSSRARNLRAIAANGHVTREELEQAEAEAAISQAKLTAAKETLQQSRLDVDRIKAQIERRMVRSPIDGVVVRVLKEPGEFVSPADAEIAKVVRLDSLRVTFHLATATAGRLSVGQTLPLKFPDTDQRCDESVVTFISPITDADSGTVRVEVTIENQTGTYRGGLRCRLIQERRHEQPATR